MPVVCINLLCSLHSSHHLLQFHIFLWGFYSVVISCFFASWMKWCTYSIWSVSVLQILEMVWLWEKKGDGQFTKFTRGATSILLVHQAAWVIVDTLLLKEVGKAAWSLHAAGILFIAIWRGSNFFCPWVFKGWSCNNSRAGRNYTSLIKRPGWINLIFH